MMYTFSNDELVRILQGLCERYEALRDAGNVPRAARLFAIDETLESMRDSAEDRAAGVERLSKLAAQRTDPTDAETPFANTTIATVTTLPA